MKDKLWTKDFIINFISNLFVYIVYYSLMVTSATHAIDFYHASASQAGLAAGLFIVGALFARIFANRFIIKLGCKAILFIGLGIYLVSSVLYMLNIGLVAYFFIRFFNGFGFGVSATGTATIAARIIPAKRLGEGIGFFSLSMTTASAIGTFIGMYLMQSISYISLLIICTGLTALSIIVSVFVSSPAMEVMDVAADDHLSGPKKRLSIHDFIEVSVLPFCITSTLIIFAYSGVITFLTKFAQAAGPALTDASKWFFLVYSAFVLFTRPISGKLLDKKSANIVIYPTIILFAVSMLMLGFAQNGLMLLFASVVMSLGYGTFFSSGNAVAIRIAPRERLHLATSTYYILADVGMGFGPFILGLFVPLIGFRGLYIALSAFILLCVPVYYFVHGKKESFTKRKNSVIE